MVNRERENLVELFAKFVDGEQAEEFAAEVRNAERMFDDSPAPEPDADLISKVNARVAGELAARQSRQMLSRIAVAAVFLIVAVLGVKLFEYTPETPPRVAASVPEIVETWEIVEVTSADPELSTLIAEVEQLESDVMTLQWAESGDDASLELTDIEMELGEIDTELWEGWNNEDEGADSSVDSGGVSDGDGFALHGSRRGHGGHLG